MTERNLSIRLSVKDSEVVRRALEGLGADGQKALERITRAAEGAGPGLEALNEITGAGRGVVEDYAGRAGVLGGALSKLGPVGLASAAAIGAVVAALGAGLHEFAAAEQSSLRLEAILKATGNTAGVTSEQIGELADELEASTMASAEQVKEAAGALATFRSVSGDAFTRAIALSQDMAATFGGDARSAAVQLGKALEDPANGLTALRRAGVTFTDAERDVIVAMMEAGDAAGAQKAVLDALEKQVGGAGAGEAGGLTGATKHLSDAWGNLLEEFVKTTGAGRDATKFLGWLTDLAKGATAAIAELPLEQKIAAAEARLAAARAKLDEPIKPGLENGLLPRTELITRERREAVAKAEEEVNRLRAEKAEQAGREQEARDSAAAHKAEMLGEAQKARIAKLQEEILKHSTDAAVKRKAVEEQLTRDIAAEESKRGKAGIEDGQVDRAIGLLRARAAQEIETIEKPARDLAERASKQLAEDEKKFGALVHDLRLQVTKVEDARAAFIQHAVDRMPEALKGREDLVETVRREAAETYDMIHALKLLGEVEEESADKRKKMEEEGKRLSESVRTAEEKHADQLAKINELYEAGVISAETRARGITQANEELANSGKNAFGELKSSVEGWGRSSARFIAEAFTSGERSSLKFRVVVMSVLQEVLEKLIYINMTAPIVQGLTGSTGLLGGMFGGGGGGGILSAIGSMFSSGTQVYASTADVGPYMSEFTAAVRHAGGLAGGGGASRPADPAWYMDAPRYHGGKGPQLYPGEVPAILLEDEEVLTSGDPRHSRNLGRMPFAPVVNVPVTLNVTTPPGTTAKTTGSRRDSGGGLTLDVLVEKIEETMGGNIRRGQGLATTLEDRYQLNPANGSFG